MAVTIYEVAKKAGVSISTVSRVLNDRGRVSADTEKKILAAIKELDFHPNINASGLAFQRTNIIGSLVFGFGDVSIPEMYALEFFTGMQEVSSTSGYNLLVINSYEDCIKLLKNKRMDGLIVHSSQDSPKLREYLEKTDFPVVFVGDHLPGGPLLDVYQNYESLLLTGFSEFKKQGILSVCPIIYGDTEEAKAIQLRLLIKISKALDMNHGIESNPENWIVNGAEDMDNVWLRIGDKMNNGFKGFLADSFYFGQQVIDASIKFDKSIRKDFSLICVEYEEDQCAWLHPPISGIYLPCRELGSSAMEILLKKIMGEKQDPVVIAPKFTYRDLV